MIQGVKMRPSRVLQKLRSGQTAVCVKCNIADSRVFEIAAMAGFDCLWTDMEHVPNDWSAVEKQILAAKAYGADVVVRVARGSYSDYIRPLELDAAGIMVPHIMSVEDAKYIAKTVRFYPIGLRPLDGGNADGAFCNIDMQTYMRDANRERFVIVQIEDPQPLEVLDEIAAVDGIDMLFFGPGDFSQAIHAPAQWEHPKIEKARIDIAKAAKKAGKFAGTVASVQNANSLIEMGYRFLSVGADVVGLSQYFGDIASFFDKASQKKSNSAYADG